MLSVLEADTQFFLQDGLAFQHGAVVTLGGIRLPTVVAANGDWLEFETPAYATVCPTLAACTGSRAFQRLQVSNPTDRLGGVVSCPDECPGSTPTAPSVLYTDPCTGDFLFGSACLEPELASTCGLLLAANVSLPGPTANSTVYANECTACPAGVVCPGGNRVWPQPGYWIPNDTDSTVTQCTPPRLERCIGWDVNNGVTLCGPSYQAGSPLCGACATGWYPSSGGLCVHCPFNRSVMWSFVTLAALLLAVCVVLTIMVVLATFRRGGTFLYGFKRGLEFFAWSCVLAQVLAQVAAAVQPSTMGTLQSLYTALALLELDVSVLVHPACIGSSRFVLEEVQFVGAIALACTAALLTLPCLRHAKQSQAHSMRIPRQRMPVLQAAGVLASPNSLDPALQRIPARGVETQKNPLTALQQQVCARLAVVLLAAVQSVLFLVFFAAPCHVSASLSSCMCLLFLCRTICRTPTLSRSYHRICFLSLNIFTLYAAR